MTCTRAWAAEFRLADRTTDHTGRTIIGTAVPFNDPTPIYEHGRLFTEQFAPGAFADSIAKRGNRALILLQHDSRGRLPVGKPTRLQETPDGLRVEARISDTTDGNDALTLVRDGVLTGLSIGFSVPEGGETWVGDTRTIHRAHLHEISLVDFPAYDRARVAEVRAATAQAFDDASAHLEVPAGINLSADRAAAPDLPTTDEEDPGIEPVGHRLHVLRLQLLNRELMDRATQI